MQFTSKPIILTLLILSFTACSPSYVIRAAYEEGKILWNRQDIDDAILNDSVPADQREKLQFVRDARAFTQKLSLDPGDSFTQYTLIDRDVLVWVVMASEKDSFTLHGWWFPIVGTVPYKGFFDKEDAIEAAKELAALGYETWVRGADAFSTLGWFNDPVLSTTLNHPIPDVVETVIHETLHATVWVPNYVDFNESLANFVGLRGAILFFEDKIRSCSDNPCRTPLYAHLRSALDEYTKSMELSAVILTLYNSLESLYQSSITKEEKLARREIIFAEIMAPYRTRYPTLKALQSINNAEIMQLKLYFTELELFDTLYRAVGEDFASFIKEVEDIKAQLDNGNEDSPFDLAKKALSLHSAKKAPDDL